MSAEIPSEWYFITPPQNVSWSKNSKSKTISTYGSNAPYLNYGTTGLRELRLSDALVEGFSDAKAVEDNILQLEACMKMVVAEDGYAAPYCFHAYAGGKSYGVFVIKQVDVKEELRDMAGKATRAKVDITLQEVSELQVASGTDITSTAISGSLSQEGSLALQQMEQSQAQSQDAAVSGAKGKGGGRGRSGGAGGANGNGGGAGGPQGAGGAGGSSTSNQTQPDYGSRYTSETGRQVIR